MGLDIVELLMEIEERFGTTIPDERAARIYTVGELYNYLVGQKRRYAPIPCPSSRAFYHLRRTLVGELGLERDRVRPAARLSDLFPRESRQTTWPRLAAALGLTDLPELDRPPCRPTLRTFGRTLAGVSAAVWLLYPVLLLVPGADLPITLWLLVWLGALVLVCELFGVYWIGRYFEPVSVPRVRDLVARLAAQHPDRYTDGDALAGVDATVWTDLVALLSAHTGVPADAIRPEHIWYNLAAGRVPTDRAPGTGSGS
jgi:hypothetical protein